MNQAVYPSSNAKLRNKVQKFAAFSGTVTSLEDFYPGQSDASGGCINLWLLC